MKKNNMIKVFLVALLGLVVTTGCSCTSQMCSETDIKNIKTEIENKNIDSWRNDISIVEKITIYPTKLKDHFNTVICPSTNTEPCSTNISDYAKQIETTFNKKDYPNIDYTKENETLDGYFATRTVDFQNEVNSRVNAIYAKHSQACLTMEDRIDPETGALIHAKTWGDAWKTGLLEGLIVFPLAWLLDSLTYSFGGTGGAQLLAIFISVFIIRILMLLMNFKGQIGNIKMQEIQPEIQKIQKRFSDPSISDNEKQALSMKMMEVYKKNNINPFASFITSFIQFPIFLAVWAAMNQTLAIRSGTLFGLDFGARLNDQIFSGNWAAIVLFILMILGQVLTMKLPTLINKFKNRNKPKVKSEKSATEKQMNWMMLFMMVLVIFSGFVLPAALVIYWVLGSVFSIIQTLIFTAEPVKNKLKSLGNRKKKAKVVR